MTVEVIRYWLDNYHHCRHLNIFLAMRLHIWSYVVRFRNRHALLRFSWIHLRLVIRYTPSCEKVLSYRLQWSHSITSSSMLMSNAFHNTWCWCFFRKSVMFTGLFTILKIDHRKVIHLFTQQMHWKIQPLTAIICRECKLLGNSSHVST